MVTKELFLKDFSFTGRHAERVIALTKEIDSESHARLFTSNVELFILAVLVGIKFNKKSKPDTDKATNTKVLNGQFLSHDADLRTAFKFAMLLGNQEEYDEMQRLSKAFRNPETDQNYTEFHEYLLGGVDELYDRLMVSTNIRFDDYLTSINKLLSDVHGFSEVDDVEPSEEDFF